MKTITNKKRPVQTEVQTVTQTKLIPQPKDNKDNKLEVPIDNNEENSMIEVSHIILSDESSDDNESE